MPRADSESGRVPYGLVGEYLKATDMSAASRERTRRVLLDAAVEQFARFGYMDTSHADIAAEAGIGRTTFYEYFASKEELLVDLVATRVPELMGELVTEIPAGLPPEDELAELTARMVEFVGTDHLGLLLHQEVPRLSDAAQARIAESHVNLSTAFTDIYRRGVERGVFREMPPRLAVRLMYQLIMTAGREVMDSPDPKGEVHDIADATVGFLLSGLKKI
jgi:AcrR family transcriptional regulator